MSEHTRTHPLDESALANDVVRLLGSENQHLKRELQEAQQRVKDVEARAREAEARAIIKKEPTDGSQDLAAAEHARQLDDEIMALRAQNQDLETKYGLEKEKRGELKAQVKELKELKSKETSDSVDKSIDLQNQLAQLRTQLDEAKKAQEEKNFQLDEVQSRIASLMENDPWSYINKLYERRGGCDVIRLKPCQASRDNGSARLDRFCTNTLKAQGLVCRRLVFWENAILWSDKQSGYGISLHPTQRYVPNDSTDTSSYHWKTNVVQNTSGEFELFFQRHGLWYYCGTYSTSIIETRNNGAFFSKLNPQFKDRLMKQTIQNLDLMPPVVTRAIKGLYTQGALPVACLIFECIGFNEELHKALLEFGKGIQGPELFALDKAKSDGKRRTQQQEAATPPKAKRARVDPGPSQPSTTSVPRNPATCP